MKKIIVLGVGLIALCCVGALLFSAVSQSVQLPNGGRASVLKVTQGTTHAVEFPAYSWGRNFKSLPKQRDLRSLGATLFSRPHGGAGAVSAAPSTVVWFHISDRTKALAYDAELITADGRRFLTKGRNGSTSDSDFCTGMKFLVGPYDDKRLTLNVNFEGRLCHFSVNNPAYEAAAGR
jgi:hypothetical protein